MGRLNVNENIVNGRLTQIGISFSGEDKQRRRVAVFRCECGTRKIFDCFKVRSGNSKSCGCLKNDSLRLRSTRHGHTKGNTASRTYKCWCSMIHRCTNKNSTCFSDYGGRGITVCNRWKDSYEAFLSDLGECDKGLTIERINNDGNYEPGNCRWATRTEQAHNTSRNRMLTHNGVSKCISEWAMEYGIKKGTLRLRIINGWSLEQALTTKVFSRTRKTLK